MATIADQTIPLVATTGKWIWRDETNSLEFVSLNASGDKLEKKKRAKAILIHPEYRRTDRVASSGVNRQAGISGNLGRSQNQSVKSAHLSRVKDSADHTTVTLEDIKTISLDTMSDGYDLSESFLMLFRSEQFDNFLLHLLRYFHCYFEKITLEKKPKNLYIEQSLSEKKAYADVCVRLEVAQKLLGQAYCVLVLGLGLEHQHHMACGLSRVSATYKDRNMYETVYAMCTYFVWISFRRKEFELVRKEVGRMLRSDTFNPANRIKQSVGTAAEGTTSKNISGDSQDPGQEKTNVKATRQASHGKRPAIKAIINQRSPAVVSILPSPKEEAYWLFRRPRPRSPRRAFPKPDKVDNDQLMDEDMDFLDKRKLRVGILGEPLLQFNRMTLMPMGTDNEEEDQEEQTEKELAEVTPADGPDRVSRQQTGISEATTEAFMEED